MSGHIPIAPAFSIFEQQDLSVEFGELLKRIVDPAPLFLREQDLQGAGCLSCARLSCLGKNTFLEMPSPSRCAAIHEYLTDGNLVQPRADPIHLCQHVSLTNDRQRDILHDILNCLWFAQATAHNGAQPSLVFEVQSLRSQCGGCIHDDLFVSRMMEMPVVRSLPG